MLPFGSVVVLGIPMDIVWLYSPLAYHSIESHPPSPTFCCSNRVHENKLERLKNEKKMLWVSSRYCLMVTIIAVRYC